MPSTILHYLYIPTFSYNSGIAHVMRAITCMREAKKENKKVDIYIPKAETPHLNLLPQNAKKEILQCMTDTFLKKYDAVFVDMQTVNYQQFDTFSKLGCCIGIDVGGEARQCFFYLIDTLPNLFSDEKQQQANISDLSLCVSTDIIKRQKSISTCKKILLYASNKSYPSYKFFFDTCAKLGIRCDYLCLQDFGEKLSEAHRAYIHHVQPTDDIKNKLYTYDMLITHYGLLAFEASRAGIPVMLVNPSSYHDALSKKNGWQYRFKNYKQLALYLQKIHTNTRLFDVFLQKNNAFGKKMHNDTRPRRHRSLYRRLFNLVENYNNIYKNNFSFNPLINLCLNKRKTPAKAIWRNKEKSIFFCVNTQSIYQVSFIKSTEYKTDYFFSEYEAQYGKTYLEDMPNIIQKMQTRLQIISKLLPNKKAQTAVNLIDIGCAYGAMVSAAKQKGCNVLGLDVSVEACSYVKKTFKTPALNVNIFEENFTTAHTAKIKKIFNNNCADIITCFFVLEHTPHFKIAIKNILDLLVTGGILALAVPNGNGISMRKNKNQFFEQNPSDHFNIFSPAKLSKYLQGFGLETRLLKITGHHPERFLSYSSKNKQDIQNVFLKTFYNTISHLIKAGDTFELYLEKIK